MTSKVVYLFYGSRPCGFASRDMPRIHGHRPYLCAFVSNFGTRFDAVPEIIVIPVFMSIILQPTACGEGRL